MHMTIKELKLILDTLPESENIYVLKTWKLTDIDSINKVVDVDTNEFKYYIKMQGDERP